MTFQPVYDYGSYRRQGGSIPSVWLGLKCPKCQAVFMPVVTADLSTKCPKCGHSEVVCPDDAECTVTPIEP